MKKSNITKELAGSAEITKGKILIEIKGGSIVSIGTNIDNLDIVIVDHDISYYGVSPVSKILSADYTGSILSEMYTGNDSQDVEIREELKRIKF